MSSQFLNKAISPFFLRWNQLQKALPQMEAAAALFRCKKTGTRMTGFCGG